MSQSDSDYQHEPESDQDLPDGQNIDQSGDGAMNQSDEILLPLRYLRQSSTVADDEVYQPQLDTNARHDIDSDSDEQSFHTRPNRWYGADSTWLSWTEDERLAVQSLDRARSQDLSIHLYNAYALKTGANLSRQSRRSRSKGKTPTRPTEAVHDDHEFVLPLPPGWSSWPLPPDQVPREPLLPQSSHGAIYRSEDDYRPSAALEECIIATTTRIARQRWKERAFLPEFPARGNLGIKVEDEVVGLSEVAETAQSSNDDDDEPSPAESDLVEAIPASPGSSASEGAAEPIFTSQGYDLDLGLDLDEGDAKGDSKDSNSEAESPVDQRPVPIADDEKAKAMLLPGVRHILSKLDDLLMGLHNARQTYATVPVRRKRDMLKDESDSAHEEDGHTEASSDGYLGRGRGRKRKRGRSASVATNVTARSNTVDSARSGKERKERWRTLQPRGWSDVVGMAALTGWDSEVVERASQRCAELFGQNMLFRTFHEGDRTQDQDSFFTEFEAGEDGGGGGPPSSDFNHSIRLIRTSRPCDECIEQEESCKAQQHLDLEGVRGKRMACRRCQEHDIPCSGIVAKFLHNRDRACPYRDCARYDQPFRNAYHLQRHIDDVHGHHDHDYRHRRQDSSLARSDSAAAAAAVPSIEWPDQIICPVTTCSRHKQPFSRGSRLYEHIRNIHPGIDVQQVKRLESKRRGERRGRYRDESRRSQTARENRSRSKSKAAALPTQASAPASATAPTGSSDSSRGGRDE